MLSVSDWLTSLDLQKYIPHFEDAEIDYAMLGDLTDEDLIEIGLPVGPRRKVKTAIAALAKGAIGTPQEPDASPERRHMTVLFVDLVGSSKLSSTLDAEDMRDVLLAYHNTISDVLRQPAFNGYVAKFMGDGALCYFGWPSAYEDDAERAVRAGLRLVEEVKALKTVASTPLSCRVGASSGNVVVGDMIGQGASAEYSLVGETANVAARLQDHAQAGQVIISDSTRRLLGNAFALETLGALDLKGIGTPTKAFIVNGEGVGRSRFDIQRGTQLVPMIGRKDDVGTLTAGWHAVQNAGGKSFLVNGDAGIGKSRLIYEFVDGLSLDDSVLLTFQCAPHRRDSAFHPVIARLRSLVGFDASDNDEAKRVKLQNASGASGDDLDLFSTLLGIELPEGSPVTAMSPGQRRLQMNRALLDWVFRAAADKPMVIVFEDLHWVDPTTEELLSLLGAAIADKRVMLLTTSRPEFVDDFVAKNPVFQQINLERMEAANVASLVVRVALADSVTPQVSTLIAERTDGVPLFVEELTKSLLENGVLQVKNGSVQTQGSLEHRAVPDTLHDILIARLDRLSLAKRTAQLAACFGRDFSVEALLPVIGEPQANLSASLDALAASNLVFQVGPADAGTYRFKHALVRDAAYGTLLKNDRRDIHQRIYDHFAATDTTAPEILAHHARGAEQIQAAIGHYVKAAEEAQARPAYLEAVAHLDNAIALLNIARAAKPDAQSQLNEMEMGLQAKRASILMLGVGFGAEAVKTGFERALKLSEDFPQSPVRVSIVYGLWVHDFVRGNNTRALVFAEQALATAKKAQNAALLVTTNRMKAVVLSMMARFTEAEDLMEEAISHFDADSHRGLGATMGQEIDVAVYAYRAINLTFIGKTDLALDLLEKGISVAKASGHVPTICHVYCHALYPALVAGKYDLIAQYADEYLDLADEHGIPMWAIYGKLSVALAEFAQDHDGAYERVVSILDQISALNSRALMGSFYTLLTRLLIEKGDFKRGADWVAKSETMFKETNDFAGQGDLYISQALIAAHRGALDDARSALSKAIECADQSGSPAIRVRAIMTGVELDIIPTADLERVMAGLESDDCPHLRPAARAALEMA